MPIGTKMNKKIPKIKGSVQTRPATLSFSKKRTSLLLFMVNTPNRDKNSVRYKKLQRTVSEQLLAGHNNSALSNHLFGCINSGYFAIAHLFNQLLFNA